MNKQPPKKKIVCIGGGTGTFVALRGLKYYPYQLSAVVGMSDSGGSNKRIRDEFGLLPTSDIRQCFVALSDDNGGAGLLRKLFMYRFDKGEGISGMTFGNLFMVALTDILHSQKDAIAQTGKVLKIHGSVIPASYTKTNLIATYEDGHVVGEEHLIDEPAHDGRMRITNVSLRPTPRANSDALSAIESADLIVLGPGDLYTSLLPNLLIGGLAQAIQHARGKKVYVVNLMTKWGQTYNFTAADHLRVLERYIGKSLDYVIVNINPIPKQALNHYARFHEVPVVNDLPNRSYFHVVGARVANQALYKKSKSDILVRSLIRHDSEKLAETLVGFLEGDTL